MSTGPDRIVLPDATGEHAATLAAGGAVAWEQPLTIRTYEAGEPCDYPLYLDRRVYQGSSGRVYPLPFTESIADTPVARDWRAVHLENAYVRLVVLPEPRRPHPHRLRQDHRLRLLLPQQRHQARPRGTRGTVDQRRRRVQLAAAPPPRDLPPRRDRDRARRGRHRHRLVPRSRPVCAHVRAARHQAAARQAPWWSSRCASTIVRASAKRSCGGPTWRRAFTTTTSRSSPKTCATSPTTRAGR
nr:hypothetical protein [Demequina litorisediminis]